MISEDWSGCQVFTTSQKLHYLPIVNGFYTFSFKKMKINTD